MKKKLGTILIEDGLIDKAQLDDALHIQRKSGSKLGTILIQLGYIEAETLAKVLQTQFQVETVTPEELSNITFEVVKLIPIDMIEDYHILPLYLENSDLYIAMSDPTKTTIISELSFFTDFAINPKLIPENLLYENIKKYYDLDIEPEYEEVIEEVINEIPALKVKNKIDSEEIIEEEIIEDNQQVPDVPIEEEVIEEEVEEQEEKTVPLTPIEKDETLIQDNSTIKTNITDDKTVTQEKFTSEEIEPTPTTPPDFEEEIYVQEEAKESTPLEMLEQSTSTDDLGEKLITILKEKTKRVLIFKVQKEVSLAWLGTGVKVNNDKLETFMIPLCTNSVFKTAEGTGESFFGPITTDHYIEERFMKFIDSYDNPPENALITPITLGNKVALLIYLDNGPGSKIENLSILPEVNQIANIVSNSLKAILSRKKAV